MKQHKLKLPTGRQTLSTAVIFAAFLMLSIGNAAYAYGSNCKNNGISGVSYSVFSPGYINTANQKSETAINKLNPKKSFMERLIDEKNWLSDNINKMVNTKTTVEIKKKTSAERIRAHNASHVITVSPMGNVIVGSGTNKRYSDSFGNIYKNNGKDRTLVSETIGGNVFVYAGNKDNMFIRNGCGIAAGFSSLTKAMDYAATVNGIILAQQGVFNEATWIPSGGRWSTETPFDIISNISIYGGYNSNGIRDIIGTPTTIHGFIRMTNVNNVTIDGVNFEGPSGHLTLGGNIETMEIYNSKNIKMTNFTFNTLNPGYFSIGGSTIGSTTLNIDNWHPEVGLYYPGVVVGGRVMVTTGATPTSIVFRWPKHNHRIKIR